jgi:hypothetical protein
MLVDNPLHSGYERQSERSFEMTSQKKRRPGRPKLPKGEAKGNIVPVRFTTAEIKAVGAAARTNNQTTSEWVRAAVRGALENTLPLANLVNGSHTKTPRQIREGIRNLSSNSEIA